LRAYEIMLILPGDADEAAAGQVIDRITQVLGDQGSVGKVDQWGRRRLAYEIAGNTEGYYVVARFEADPTVLKELDRTLSLADQVIRFKVMAKVAAKVASPSPS